MEEVKSKFFGREISVTERPKDSTVLQENLELLNGEYFPTTNITESNFLLYDRQGSNLIKYGKGGRQIKKVGPEFDDLAEPDSTFIKYIYYAYWPGRVEWDTVATSIYWVDYYFSGTSMNILGVYNANEQNTYILTEFKLPIWDSIRTGDGTYKRGRNGGYLPKTFLTKYDTGMRLIKEYLVLPIQQAGYRFSRSSEFVVTGDTLYRNVVNDNNDTARFLVTYYLDRSKGAYVPFRLSGRVPEFLRNSSENKLYYDEAAGNLVSVFSYSNVIYDQKTKKTWSLPGIADISDSTPFDKDYSFKNIYYFISYSDTSGNFFKPHAESFRNFVYWYRNKLYLVQTDGAGQLKRRWNLLDHGLSASVSCFNDREYLYVVSSREEDVVMYRFSLSDFR
jgi:hypothetical protein